MAEGDSLFRNSVHWRRGWDSRLAIIVLFLCKKYIKNLINAPKNAPKKLGLIWTQ